MGNSSSWPNSTATDAHGKVGNDDVPDKFKVDGQIPPWFDATILQRDHPVEPILTALLFGMKFTASALLAVQELFPAKSTLYDSDGMLMGFWMPTVNFLTSSTVISMSSTLRK